MTVSNMTKRDIGLVKMNEELELIKEVLDSKCLSGFLASPGEGFMGGKMVKRLEGMFKEYFGVKHALAVNSATSGLECAVKAVTEPGDEVIVTPFSMSASATCIVHAGCKPVFVDIEDRTFNIDATKIEEAITDKTTAIIAVHLFGNPCDMDTIGDVAQQYDLRVIEDCAQALDVWYRGLWRLGTLSGVGVFSFNQYKTLNTGEGGMVITDNNALAIRIAEMRNHGEIIGTIFGHNYRMTELTAAVGVARFKPPFPDYPVRAFRVDKKKRKEYAKMLRECGFTVSEGYVKPIYLLPAFQEMGYKKGLCPVAERMYYEELLTVRL